MRRTFAVVVVLLTLMASTAVYGIDDAGNLRHRLRTVGLVGKLAALAALVGIQFVSLNFLRPHVVLQPGYDDHNRWRRNDGTTAHSLDDFDGANDGADDDAIIFRGKLVKDHFSRKGEGKRFRPVVKVLHHRQWDCPAHQTWEYVQTAGAKMNEMLQETGFLRFFFNFYPLVEHWSLMNDTNVDDHQNAFLPITSSIPTKDCLYFVPSCFYTNTSLPVPFNHTAERTDGFHRLPSSDDVAAILTFRHNDDDLQKRSFRINKQAFWVSTHPLQTLYWASQFRNVRTLRTDDAAAYAAGDVIIPVSVELEQCPIHLPLMADKKNDNDTSHNISSTRPRLLFGCGSEHSKRYPLWRRDLFRAVGQLNRSDVFAATGMSWTDYRQGFFSSKFCFVVPGDTISTSQATRAMCGGCVPIFVILDDPRSLPFSNLLNYRSFSLIKTIDELLGPDEASSLPLMQEFVQELGEMVTDGTYERLRTNVHRARDFFNYHRFDGRSPYAMAVLAMAMDQQLNAFVEKT